MRVWVLHSEGGEDREGLETLLRQCSQQLPLAALQVSCQPLTSGLAAAIRREQPELLVVAQSSNPSLASLGEILALGVSLIVLTTAEQAEPYRSLAERYPLYLAPLPPSGESLSLALLTAQAGHYRQQHWSTQVAQLQQRLQDRILIERAKGILVQRLAVSEEEAYQRLRVLSRRQRRPIRDIAQSLLDTHLLLDHPESTSPATPEEAPAPPEQSFRPSAGRTETVESFSKE
jgi:AmiR/NasT family two-component response regulator